MDGLRFDRGVSAFQLCATVVLAGCYAHVDASTPSRGHAATAARVAEKARMESWRKTLARTPRPKKACFAAKYPETAWRETPCKAPPNRPYLPKFGRSPKTVGHGTDFSAGARTLAAEGSFDSVTGVTGESANGSANAYSLQLNTNRFHTRVCNGGCLGEQQFVYTSSGSVFIEYWLDGFVDSGASCPSGWNACNQQGNECVPQATPASRLSCWVNSANAAAMPAEPVTSLDRMTLHGSPANDPAGSDHDWVYVTVDDTSYSAPGDNQIPDLIENWQTTEFNVFGDGNGDQAEFNVGSTIVVRTSVSTGTSDAPALLAEGITAETNNLTLVPGSAVAYPANPQTGQDPAITFTETRVACPDGGVWCSCGGCAATQQDCDNACNPCTSCTGLVPYCCNNGEGHYCSRQPCR